LVKDSKTSCAEQLYCMGNAIKWSIPTTIGKLSKLSILYGGSLGGTIPTEIGNCTSLKELVLNGDDLESTIPTEIGMLKNLGTYFVIMLFKLLSIIN
jgi:Leucine-rich repeat (LRR) protein